MPRPVRFIEGVSDIVAIKNNCGAALAMHGVEDNGFIEAPVAGDFSIIVDRLPGLLAKLSETLESSVVVSKEADNAAMRLAQYFESDATTREAAIDSKYYPYQHLLVHGTTLYAIFHQSVTLPGEFMHNFYYMLTVVQKFLERNDEETLPALSSIQLRWTVDCFRKPVKKVEPVKA